MHEGFLPGATLTGIATLLAVGVLLILTSGINDFLANKVWLRVRPLGSREFRTRFDSWVAIPVIGLLVSMAPLAVVWAHSAHGWLAAQGVFFGILYLLMWLGFFLGVLRYDEGRQFKDYTSARNLLARIREAHVAGEVFNAHDLRHLDVSMARIAKGICEPAPEVKRLVKVVVDPYDRIERAEVHRLANWRTDPRRLGTAAFWRESLSAPKRGWLLCVLALSSGIGWIIIYGELARGSMWLWGGVLGVLYIVILGCMRLAIVASDVSIEYEAKLHVLEREALSRLVATRPSLRSDGLDAVAK